MKFFKQKRFIGLILAIFILLIVYSLVTPLNCFRTLGTRTIFIYNTTDGYGVKHTDDKNEILKLLRSMKLKKSIPFNIDNLYYRIYIQRNLRETITIGIFPEGIVIDGNYYHASSMSYEKMYSIFEKLHNRYPTIKVGKTNY